MARIEAVDRCNQAYRSGGDQIVQVDALRQTLMDAPGDQPHLREVVENQAFPLFDRVVPDLVLIHCLLRCKHCDALMPQPSNSPGTRRQAPRPL